LLNIGTLKSFNSTDYRAEVQLAGSMAAYLDNIPVARNIASDQMTVGRHVILAIPGGNPKDACIIAVWDAAAGGGGGGGAHRASHEWLGADELNLTALLAHKMQVIFDWQTHDAWTEAMTGSAYVTWQILYTLFRTGSTINSEAKVYTAPMGAYYQHPGFDGQNYWKIESSYWTLATSLAWIGHFSGITPGDTVRHSGWKLINGEIWASTSNGTNQTITDTGISIAARYAACKLFIAAGGSEAKFYVNNVLKATHTTNLPGGGNLQAIIYLKNTTAAERSLRVLSSVTVLNNW